MTPDSRQDDDERRTQMSFNKITLVGNLGRDPELRYTPQGTPVCSFSLATNERRKDRNTGENNDITTWFRVTLWGRQAETASQYLTRGRPVYIEGRLRVEEWTDRDGKPRHTLEVHATDMQFIGGGRGEEGGAPAARAASAPSQTGDPAPEPTELSDDDIPF
jgi:single-strand DNA-binding protein